MLNRILLLLSLSLMTFLGLHGQGVQAEYLEAKRLFRNGDFVNARSAFASLFDNDTFGLHAVFFAGLSAYEEGDVAAANSIWKQLVNRNSQWEEIGEVYYWLMLSSYQMGEVESGIIFSQRFNDFFDSDLADQLATIFLEEADKELLVELNGKFPDHEILARTLASRLDPQDEEEGAFLRELIAKFDLKLSDYSEVNLPTVKKEAYAIGVMLPFMFDGLSNPEKTISNRVIMDLYQGMLLAESALNEQGHKVRLYPYDTKRKKEVTKEALSNLEDIDLLVGPLFGEPIEEANSFSNDQKVNLFNPVSSNLNAVRDNAYGFLLKPSYETMAAALADHTSMKVSNKNALVYFSKNLRDSVFAEAYRQKIEADSFQVIEFRGLDNELSKEILDSLTAQHEEYIATLEEVDSLMEIQGRFIKEKEPDPENEEELAYALVRIDEEGEPGDSLIYYEMKFNVVPDSIGHIMVASRDNGIVNNFIGAIEARPDSIGLFGYGNWQDFEVVDFNQLERLQVNLANPEYLDSRNPRYQELDQLVKETYRCPPSSYHYLGYETIFYLGSMLTKYGKYFQNHFMEEGDTPGMVLPGFRYGLSKDNQVVPIVTLRNSTLIPIDD